MKLTVILRNDSPMIHCGDSPSLRSVQVDLTPDQCAAITPRKTGSSGGVDEYETISQAFIEPARRVSVAATFPAACSCVRPRAAAMVDDKFVYRRRLGDNFIWKVKRTTEGDGLHVGTAYCATVSTMDWRREHCPVDIESYAPVSESEVRNLIRYAEATLNKEKRIKELEWKLAKMVRWLDEHQPDVWKRGLWDALEPE